MSAQTTTRRPTRIHSWNILLALIAACSLFVTHGVSARRSAQNGVAQTESPTSSSPTPTPSPTAKRRGSVRRTSGVKLSADSSSPAPAANSTAVASSSPSAQPTTSSIDSREAAARVAREKRDAANAAVLLEGERQAAITKALDKERAAAQAQLEKERMEARAKIDAAHAAAESARRETEQAMETARAERERIAQEDARARAVEQGLAREREAALSAKIVKEHFYAKTEREREAEAARREAAKQTADLVAALAREAKLAKEKDDAEAARRKEDARRLRASQIIETARKLGFSDPVAALALVHDTATDIDAALKALLVAQPNLVPTPSTPATSGFCSPNFVGELYTFDVPEEVPLGTLLNDLRYRFKLGFLPDTDVVNLPVQVNVSDIPWNLVLRSVLADNDLDVECGAGSTLHIVKRAKLAAIQDNRRRSAPLVTDFIKLKYLQPSSGGLVNIAGKPQGGSGSAFESLEAAIDKILHTGGDTRGSVSRVPGRNELFITATADQLTSIKRIIDRADRRPYQVLVQALVYTANDSKTRDIGVQGSIILGNGNGSILGGLTTQPAGTSSGGSSSGSTSQSPGSVVPGGVRGLGSGFQQPSKALGAAAPNTVLGLSTILGTAQFSVQATALSQRGLINIQSRPFTLVQDGEPGNLDVGRQIPVVTQAASGVGGIATGTLEILNAGSLLQVTPQVAEDENGVPSFITVNLRLESNDVDTSIITQGVPSVTRRSIQSKFLLRDQQTVVIGGFSADSVSHARSKTPGLGNVPILGNLFKRKLDQENRDRLYFAIAVRVIPLDQNFTTVDAPSDANPRAVAPPDVQSPSPFETDVLPSSAPAAAATPRP